MQADKQIALVETYFKGVDGEDLPSILATLTADCVFTVETHGIRLVGYEEISGMFNRLWANHRAVRHDRFVYVPDPKGGRIACQFQVQNTELNGEITRKSNCNFFKIQAGKFSSVAVYMAGPNTLEGAES